MSKDSPLFSIITIVNKEKVYEDFKRSLESQKEVNYELVKIDNNHNQFFSAREAYNDAINK